MPAITVDGIVSGLDTTSLIESILSISQDSITTLEGQKEDAEQQLESVTAIKAKLVALSDAIKAMDTEEEFVAYTASTSSEQFEIEALDGAEPGAYNVRVVSLATAQVTTSDGFDDTGDSVLGAGTLTVTVAGEVTNVVIDGTNDSLSGLVTELNEIDGISAYIVDTGAAVGRYRLVVQGEDTGADNTFTVDTSALVGATYSPIFTDDTTAADAEVEIAGLTVYSASNTLEEVVPGIRLTLLAEGLTTDQGVISEDLEATRAKLQAVVDAYNEVLNYYNAQTVFNAEEGLKGALVGEGTTRRVLSELGQKVSASFTVTGFDFDSLAQFGFETNQDGTLTFDTDTFDDAWATDPDAVIGYLTDDTGPLTSLVTLIDDLYVDDIDGALSSRESTIEGTVEDLSERIETAQARYEAQEAILRARFARMEAALGDLQATQGYIAALFGTDSNSS